MHWGFSSKRSRLWNLLKSSRDVTSKYTFSKKREDPEKMLSSPKIVSHYTWGGMRDKPEKVCIEG